MYNIFLDIVTFIYGFFYGLGTTLISGVQEMGFIYLIYWWIKVGLFTGSILCIVTGIKVLVRNLKFKKIG